jgi:hypothetical protein
MNPAHQHKPSMPFHPLLSSSIRGFSPDYEDNDGPNGRITSKELKNAPTRMTRMTTRSGFVPRTTRKRARSPSSDATSSDDGINEPVTPPPIIHELSRFVKRAKTHPGAYRRSPNGFERLLDNQIRYDDRLDPDKVQKVS